MVTVAIDIDEVLLKNNAPEVASKELGYNYTRKDIKDYNYSTFPEELRNRIAELFDDTKYMTSLEPIKGSQETVHKWAKKGYNLICVSSRRSPVRIETNRYIKKLYPEISYIFYDTTDKTSILEREKTNYFIDDSNDFVKLAINRKIKTFLVSNDYTKYNHELAKEKNEFLTVVKSINDVEI